jgi:hypothetical protein
MDDDFKYKEPTEQDIQDITEKIERLSKSLISLPVDTCDLLNHYDFKEKKEFLCDNVFKTPEDSIFKDEKDVKNKFLTPEESLNKFMYETHPFKIFGDSEEYPNAMSYFNRIQAFGVRNNLFETVLLTDLKSNAITANYFFLHKTGCRARNIQVVKDNLDKWNYCDVLVDVISEVFQYKPYEKVSIKIDRLYNEYDNADYTLKNIKELENEELLNKLFKL